MNTRDTINSYDLLIKGSNNKKPKIDLDDWYEDKDDDGDSED